MSVYSNITTSQLEQFFSHYALGQVIDYVGITEGIDNTNYLVCTTQNEFVLTIFESLNRLDLIDFIGLLAYLRSRHLPCPYPVPDKQGDALLSLNHKPAAVFAKLSGRSVVIPTLAHCPEIGLYLAKLHQYTQGYDFPVPSQHDFAWCKNTYAKIKAYLTEADACLISDELHIQAAVSTDDLPVGVIHGDLFRDNVLFIDEQLTGLLDFYSAGTGYLILDIAITVNDWCQCDGGIDVKKLTVLLKAYQSIRLLTVAEKQYCYAMLRLAALRFWLSRLEHVYFQRVSTLSSEKDPKVFRQILEFYRHNVEKFSQ